MNKPLIILTLLGLVLMSGCTTAFEKSDYCREKCAEEGYGYGTYIGESLTDIKCICDTNKQVVLIE